MSRAELLSAEDGLAMSKEYRWMETECDKVTAGPVRERVPPERGLSWLAQRVQGRIRKDFDAVIIVSGPEGSGKSTLTMEFFRILRETCPEWYRGHPGETWPHYLTRDYLADARVHYRGKQLWYDEATRGGHRRRGMSNQALLLIQNLTVIRAYLEVHVLVMPRERRLDEELRERAWCNLDIEDPEGRPGIAKVHFNPDWEPSLLGLADRKAKDTQFVLSPDCPEVKWEKIPNESPRWREYFAKKLEEAEKFNDWSVEKLDEDEAVRQDRRAGREERARKRREAEA